MEAVGETGEGGFSYPAIQRHIRRCGLALHKIGLGAACSGKGDGDLGGLWDDDGGSRGGVDAGENEYDCGRFDEGGGGSHHLGGGRRRLQKSPDSGQGWTSSSGDEDGDGHDDDDDNGFGGETACVGTRGGSTGLVRSPVLPLFVRSPTYFAELLGLGRVLCAVHPGGGPRRTVNGAAGRARRQATAYLLTLVRMCCDFSSGGLDNAEPLGWVGGGRELDEDAATLQRTQLMVDARLAEKLAPCLNDPDPDVRRDAVSCALSALRGGHARLRWIFLSVRETEGVDPRALLAMGFCTTVWVSAFVSLLRGRGSSALGSINPSSSARQGEENVRRMALQCLGYMAAAGDLATHSWRAVRVLSALQGLLDRESTITAGVVRRSSTAGVREGGRPSDFNGWVEGVSRVLRALAQNGSRETTSMLRAQPGLGAALNDPELILNSESLLAPKGLASTAIELLEGSGTLNEITSLVQRTRSTLATAVRIGDQRVIGSTVQTDEAGIPDDVGVTLSLIWGWMQRALVQLARDESDHPSSAARASLAWECLGLMQFLLASVPACRLARCKIHPDLAAEVSRVSGGGGGGVAASNVTADATSDLAVARTGLEILVFLSSVESPTILDLHRVHPIPPLAVGAADALADSLTQGDRGTVEAMESYGLGVRLGLAVEASTRLVRESRRLGVEEVHLLRLYPAGRRARVKLLDRLLCQRGGDRGGGNGCHGLHEQVIVSGLVEFLTSNMLPDCTVTDVASVRLPAGFVRHNGTPLVRNEGIALLERIVARRSSCPAVAREAARQAVRHDIPTAECTRLREHRHRSVRAGVGACLRCLARLDSPAVDRALMLAGVPQRAVLGTRRDHAASKTRRQWARWVRHKASAAGETLPASSTQEPPYPRDEPVGRSSLASPFEPSGLRNGKSKKTARQHRDRDGGSMQALRAPTITEGRSGIDVHRQANPTVSATHPEVFAGTDNGVRKPLTLPNTTPCSEREQRAVLTIEGDLETLSVPDLLGLLTAELATTEESIRIIEIGGANGGGGGSLFVCASRQAPTAAGTVPPRRVAERSVLKLSLTEALAGQLYTRCLAGVLRVPGLLYLEVRTHSAVALPKPACLSFLRF